MRNPFKRIRDWWVRQDLIDEIEFLQKSLASWRAPAVDYMCKAESARDKLQLIIDGLSMVECRPGTDLHKKMLSELSGLSRQLMYRHRTQKDCGDPLYEEIKWWELRR